MAQYLKTSAIVLRTVEYSESSQIVTLCTEHFGKLRGIAKGARRASKGRGKATGGAGMDLLNLCEIVFVKKPPPGLDIISSWLVVEGFTPLRTDLERLYAALYAAELVDRATDEGEAEPRIFRLLASFLRALCRGTPRYPALLRFELLLLAAAGFAPQIERCVSCGGELGKKPGISPSAGGALCAACATTVADAKPIPPQTLVATSRLIARDATASRLGMSKATISDVRRLLDRHIVYHLGRSLEMRAHVAPQN